MASDVNRQSISVEAFFFFLVVSWEAVDLCLWVCVAFFITGLQPQGCTKQLNRVETGRPNAGARRLQAPRPAPQKIMRSPRRLFKAGAHAPTCVASSWSARRAGSLTAKASSSAAFGRKPSRTGVPSKRRGREQWRTGASWDQRPQPWVSRSTLGGARPWRASVRRCGSPARSAWSRQGAGIVLSLSKIVVVCDVIVSSLQRSLRTARGRDAPGDRTRPAPRQPGAGASASPTGPERCRRRHSESSKTGSCPGGQRRHDSTPNASRATGTDPATAAPDAGAAGSRSAPTHPADAARLGHGGSRWRAWWLSTRDREEEHVRRGPRSARPRAGLGPCLTGRRWPGRARRRLLRAGVPEAVLVEGLLLAQHVVDGPRQPGGQHAHDLGLAVLLLLLLLPLPG